MRILFDNGVPRPLRKLLRPHTVETAAANGWERLSNGQLLDAAEEHEFDVLLTGDQNMPFQQNLAERRVAVVVLERFKWPDVTACVPRLLEVLRDAQPGTCTVVE